MSVNITFSSTNGGSVITEPLSHGSVHTGSLTAPQLIYVRHDMLTALINCGLYINSVDIYTGNSTAIADLAELISWGDATDTNNYGGVQINFNAAANFPASSWPNFSNKTTSDGYGFTIRTGVGDSVNNALVLPVVAGASLAGVLQAGAAPNVRFQARLAIPNNIAGNALGYRQFRLEMRYTYTS